MTTKPIYLNALGIHNPLGHGKAAVCDALFSGSQKGLQARNGYLPDRPATVGVVSEELPALPSSLAQDKGSIIDSRNNRLLGSALLEIEANIRALREKFGPENIGVVMGTSTSGVGDNEQALRAAINDRGEQASIPFAPQSLGDPARTVALIYDLTGPALSISTACSSSAKVFATARRFIRSGICKAVLVGGADSLCKLTVNGFASLEALAEGIAKPFSKNRDGINIGEGAAIFILSEEPDGIPIAGIGESCDAHHMSAPDPEGQGAYDAMAMALKDAQATVEDVSYINLHGTGTALNDAMEAKAVTDIGANEIYCSSTKALTGHLLGAAGVTEIAFLWLSAHQEHGAGRLPPHVWDRVPDPDLPALHFVSPGDGIERETRSILLSNSFAFGGSNVCLGLWSHA